MCADFLVFSRGTSFSSWGFFNEFVVCLEVLVDFWRLVWFTETFWTFFYPRSQYSLSSKMRSRKIEVQKLRTFRGKIERISKLKILQ